MVHSLDYEWYPTEEYAERPHLLAETVAGLFGQKCASRARSSRNAMVSCHAWPGELSLPVEPPF